MRPCSECQQQLDDEARFCPFCGAASPVAEPPDPMVGATISGKFKVEKMIGQGGMGKVYRARHLTLDRPVVLKMLHRAYSDDPQIVQRFQREARAASRLNHPNSIAVLDFGAAEDGTLYMAMEYLGGRDLARVVAEEFPLAEGRIVRIGAQILSALAEAHAQGIIHRDLKPENVMVEPRRDEPDFVKVLDFGIAKITAAAENEPKLTQAGLVCGTPEYMSPEQARGADLDARSDLYSVGVILYQLATGELPFQSDTPVGFLTKHLAEIPVPPRQKRPEVSEPLDALIRQAMEKDRTRRFADAESMRQALLACAEPRGLSARPERVAGPAHPGPGAGQPSQGAPPAATLQIDVAEDVPAGALAAATPARPRSRVPLVVGAGAVVAVALAAVLLGRGEPAPPPAPPVAVVPPVPTQPPTPTQTPTAEPPAAEPPPVVVEPVKVAPPPAPAAAVSRARALRLLEQGRARLPGDPDGAVALLTQARQADPSLAEVHKRLATAHQLKGDLASARVELKRYLATNPPDAAKVRAVLSTLE